MEISGQEASTNVRRLSSSNQNADDNESQQTSDYRQVLQEGKITSNEAGGAQKNEKQNRFSKRDSARRRINKAMKLRNPGKLRNALKFCIINGIDETTIYHAEEFMEVVQEEEQLLEEMSPLLKKTNVDNLDETTDKFRAPETDFVDETDQTDDVSEDDKFLEDLETQRLMNLKEDIFAKLKSAREDRNDKEVDSLIQKLEEKPLRNVVEEDDIDNFKQDLKLLRHEIVLQKNGEDLMASINQMIRLEDLPKLEQALDNLRHTMNEQFYKKNDEATAFLTKASETFNNLVAKHKLIDEIEEAWKGFDLPLLPDSLASLKASLIRIKALKKESINIDGAFTTMDDDKLAKYKKDIEILEVNVIQRDKSQASLKSALEKRSYEDLKRALKKAKNTLLLDDCLVAECENLRKFLHPKTRKTALIHSCKQRDVRAIEKAIEDFKSANVTKYPEKLLKAEKLLKLLKHIEKLNNILQKAIEDRKIETLCKAIQTCERAKIHHDRYIPLLSKAKELLIVEKLKKNLTVAVESRNLKKLAEALQNVEESEYKDQLEDEFNQTKELYDHLTQFEILREHILLMNDSLISEIRNYSKPPQIVKSVMAAVFQLLGEPPSVRNKVCAQLVREQLSRSKFFVILVDDVILHLVMLAINQKGFRNWVTIQGLMRQTIQRSMKKRIKRCKPEEIDSNLRRKVEKNLIDLDVDAVKAISIGASAFFAWVTALDQPAAVSVIVADSGGEDLDVISQLAKLDTVLSSAHCLCDTSAYAAAELCNVSAMNFANF